MDLPALLTFFETFEPLISTACSIAGVGLAAGFRGALHPLPPGHGGGACEDAALAASLKQEAITSVEVAA